ncbi:transposase [[Clostridium] innocuum]|uniref:transposase n=1 Tax=Clostridium innocuum TaxID=1522 RepID=UPI003A5988E3
MLGKVEQESMTLSPYSELFVSKFKLSDRDLIAHTRTDMLYKYFLGYNPEKVNFINPSSLSKFRHMRLKDLSTYLT